jgi:hypothetical protein
MEKRLFSVFGIFCSWNCAKAYIQSNYSSDSSEQIMWMRILAHEVFNCNIDELNPAPPRIFLKMFGGHLTIEEFRKKCITTKTVLLKPPLISYPIVLQEQSRDHSASSMAASSSMAAPRNTSGRIIGLQRPKARTKVVPKESSPNPQNAMYTEFIQRKQCEVLPIPDEAEHAAAVPDTRSVPAARSTRDKERGGAHQRGTLEQFLRA